MFASYLAVFWDWILPTGNVPFGIDPVPAVARASLEVDPAEAGLPVSHDMDGVDVGFELRTPPADRRVCSYPMAGTEGVCAVPDDVRAELRPTPVCCPGGVAVVFQVPVVSPYVCPEETVRFRCLQ